MKNSIKTKKPAKIELRQKSGSRGVSTGRNTEILVNGKRLDGVRKATIEVEANGLAIVKLEMIGAVRGIGQIDPEHLVLNKNIEGLEEEVDEWEGY